MKLYHGTSSKHLPQILKEGLKPRGKDGTNNWTHSVGSNPKTIYLTNAYAIYFAHSASKDEEDMVVLEIDTDKLNFLKLVPDEDFLEQTSRKGGPAPQGKSMKYRTMWYRRRLEGFQQYWLESVNGLGTCGYLGPIPPKAITRYAVIPNERRWELIMAGMDPMISIMNYRLCGDRYRNWVRWAFDDPLEDDNRNDEAFSPAFMRKISREGINVVSTSK